MTKAKRDPPKERKPKLTDAERYKRFLDAAKEVGASESHADFDKAFHKVVGAPKSFSGAPKPKCASQSVKPI